MGEVFVLDRGSDADRIAAEEDKATLGSDLSPAAVAKRQESTGDKSVFSSVLLIPKTRMTFPSVRLR